MAVVSAGSLCAGAKDLPTGNYRGYNIIEINDNMRQARVHMREMSVANLFSPSRRGAIGGASWVDLNWEPPADLSGMPAKSAERRIASILAQAEEQLIAGLPKDVKELLRPLSAEMPTFGRLLLLQAARQTNDTSLLLRLLVPPRSIGELVELTELCIGSKDFAGARHHLDGFGSALKVTEPHARELRARIAAAETISK
jgi:hypothetical protein